MLFYLVFLFVYTDMLPPNIKIESVTYLVVYAISDWFLLLFAWVIQKNVIARRNELFSFKAGGISQEKKDDDLFDVRYLPEEYMSDVQNDSDEEDELEGDAAINASEMAKSDAAGGLSPSVGGAGGASVTSAKVED